MTPNQPKTPLRTIRVDDELWKAASKVAKQRGESVSDAVRRSLRRYVSTYTRTAKDDRRAE